MRLSQVSLLLDAELTPVLTAHVQLNADAEPDEAGLRSRADLVEAFVLYRPELSEKVRLRLRGGAFFPPISLEHEGPAWTSAYTITGSAANSWPSRANTARISRAITSGLPGQVRRPGGYKRQPAAWTWPARASCRSR